MIERNITLPEMILWTGTRIALGAGIGVLISRRLQGRDEGRWISSGRRRRVYDESTGDRHHR